MAKKKKTMKLDVEVLYDLTKDGEVGQVFTYKYLMSLPPFNIDKKIVRDMGKEKLQRAVGGCNEVLLEKKQFRLINLKGVGYKIGHPGEQLVEVDRRKKKANKQIRRGMYEAAYINKKIATPGEKQVQEQMLAHLSVIHDGFAETDKPLPSKAEIKEIERIAKSYCGGYR